MLLTEAIKSTTMLRNYIYTTMALALALAITLRARRAILLLPWTAQHQFNTRNTATGFILHPFVVTRWVRVYSSRSQRTALLSILPKVVGKNFEASEGPPSFMRCETTVGTEKRRPLISVGLHAINYKRGARSEITFFNRRAKRVKFSISIFFPSCSSKLQ